VPRGPKKTTRPEFPGFIYPSEAVARNVRSYRLLQRLTQAELAERMSALGFEWNESTVGYLERYQRKVEVDELVGLTICFELKIWQLLDPTGPAGTEQVGLNFGSGGLVVGVLARMWLEGRNRRPILHGARGWRGINADDLDEEGEQ
jgi:hypothetical protein